MTNKILIVEDDQMILNSLSEALSLKDYDVYQSITLSQADDVLKCYTEKSRWFYVMSLIII